jgi:DNA-binding beta-propeller fold protein YncE
MSRILRTLLLTATLLAPVPGLAAPPPYHLVETVPLGGGIKWDYLDFDPATGDLFISHGTELTVVAPSAGKVIGHAGGLQGSHGIAIDSHTGLLYADSAKTETVSIFDAKSLHLIKTIPALEDADGMVFDPTSSQVFVAGGDANAVLAIDAITNLPVKTVPLGGAPEFLVVDGKGHLYININDKNQLVELDSRTDAITARWPLPGCERPTGLAIDPTAGRLFSSCENAKLAVIDTRSGELVSLLPIGKGSDAVRFDPARKLIFSSNRDGSLSIIQERGPEDFVPLASLPTLPGARTMDLNPANGDLFLVTADILSSKPPKFAGGPPLYRFKPGTLRLLVYRPADIHLP